MPHLHRRLGREIGFFHGGLPARQRDELVEAFSHPGRAAGPRDLDSRRRDAASTCPPRTTSSTSTAGGTPPSSSRPPTARYRFGQHKDVFVHSLICTATLEERIDELLDSKRELAEKVVAGRADDWLGELDLDAIRAAVSLSDDSVEAAA